MICTIEGILKESEPLRAVIEVNGLGYEVHVPLTTAEQMPSPGSTVRLHTLQVFREDAQLLFGFASLRDKNFFRILTEKVSGVGPRLALNLLSRLTVSTLEEAIAEGNVALLSQCPGIGRKTAERLIVELRDTLKKGMLDPGPVSAAAGEESNTQGLPERPAKDALAALMALGYKLPEADKAVRQAVSRLGPDAQTEAIVRAALSGK